jgi:hypothetical protein
MVARSRLTRLLQRTRKLRFLAAEQHTRYALRIGYDVPRLRRDIGYAVD